MNRKKSYPNKNLIGPSAGDEGYVKGVYPWWMNDPVLGKGFITPNRLREANGYPNANP